MNRFRVFLPILVFALLAIIPLWKAVFLGQAIGPFDQIKQMAPWNGPQPNQPWDVLQADGVLQFYPWRNMVFDAWGKGQLPLWNPHQLAGTPLLANSQSAGFYPPHILMGVLHVPTTTAMKLLAWFHLFWAGLGCFALARKLGSLEAGRYLAGALFCLSPFMVAWVALPSVISTVSWIPWCLWAVLAVFTTEGRLVRSAALLAFSVAMMLLAGHLQFAAYGFIAMAVVALIQLISPDRRGLRSLAVVAGLIGGFLMSAPQLLPVLSYSGHSHRQSTPSEEGYAAYSASSIQPWELIGLGVPNAVGLPTVWADMEQPIPSYWPEFLKRGDNFAESAIGVGGVALALLLLLPFCGVDWKRIAGIASVGLVGFLLATGSVLGRILYFFAPGWSSTGSPGRAEVLFVLAACVLTGVVATTKAKKEAKGSAQFWPAAIPAFALVTVFLVLPSLRSSPYFEDSKVIQALVNSVVFQMLPGAIAAAVLAMVAIGWWIRSRDARSIYGLTIASIVGVMTTYALVVVPTSDSAFEQPPITSSTRIAAINEPWEILSVAPAVLPPNTASANGLNDLGGYDSLLDRDTVELLRDIDGEDPAPPANGNMMFIKPNADPGKLADAGVTEVWTTKYSPHFGTPISSDGGIYKYRVNSQGRAFVDGGTATIQEDGYDRQTIQATGPGTLWVKDRNMEGWSASVDGAATPIAPGLWRSVEIPASNHNIEFRYHPPGLRNGFLLGAVGWLAFGLILAFGRTPKKSGSDSAKPAVE